MIKLRLLCLLTVVIIAISSCATTSDIDGGIHYSAYDFRDYTEKGFLLTPETYRGNYESIGMIRVDFIPNIQSARTGQQGQRPAPRDGHDVVSIGTQFYYVEKPNHQEIIDEIYNMVVEMGANAIINFRLDSEPIGGHSQILRVIVNGFAIKRTDI